jgi:hypothetical protein
MELLDILVEKRASAGVPNADAATPVVINFIASFLFMTQGIKLLISKIELLGFSHT